jgi:hypothetical protein
MTPPGLGSERRIGVRAGFRAEGWMGRPSRTLTRGLGQEATHPNPPRRRRHRLGQGIGHLAAACVDCLLDGEHADQRLPAVVLEQP